MTFDFVSILAQESSGSSPLGMLILFVPLGLLLYMMIVPQRKQKQKQADMLSKLDVGDEVLTTGGIVGLITYIEDDLFHLEVDTDVVIRVARSAIARSTSEPDPAAKPPSRSRKAKDDAADAGADDESSE